MNKELFECFIETDRLILFPYTLENLRLFNKSISEFEKYYGLKYEGEDLDYLLKDFLIKLEKEIEEDLDNYLFFTEFLIVLKVSDVIIGSIDYKYLPVDGVTEVGYGLNPKYQGFGYMKEALSAFLDFGKKRGIKRVLADTVPDNLRSQKTLTSCGFKYLKTDKNIWFEKDL